MVPLFFWGCRCCASGCTPGGDSVLVWDKDNQFINFSLTGLKTVYTDEGITVDDDTDWSGDIDDYRLILWRLGIQDPSWWDSISDGSWCGRLFMAGDHNVNFQDAVTYIDGKSPLTGIGMTGDSISGTGTVETDDLTDGQSSFTVASGSVTDGGTLLSKLTSGGEEEWLARNKPSDQNVDFVISGDQNIMTITHDIFFLNMYDVDI